MPIVLFFLAFLGFHLFRFKGNEKLKLMAIILAVYFIMIQLAFKVEPWSAERYLSPVFPVLFFIAFGTLQDLEFKKVAWWKPVYLHIFLALWWLYPLIRTLKNAGFWHQINCGSLIGSGF